MSTLPARYVARVLVDGQLRIMQIEEPVAAFQAGLGGRADGPLAIPELRGIAAKALEYQLRLSRSFAAISEFERIVGWVDATPLPDGGGCELAIASWQSEPIVLSDEDAQAARVLRELNRALPEFAARLDADQQVMAAEDDAPDLADLAEAMRAAAGRPWTEFVLLADTLHDQASHWRFLDGASVRVPGSHRQWTAWLEPLGVAEPGSSGFVLTLASDEPPWPRVQDDTQPAEMTSLGEDVAPTLRQPINRIISHAESIQSKLAGPLADVYAGYAGDIIDAGEHLQALIEDIADVQGVDAPDFPVVLERIDLAEAARQACGILGARAQGREIALVLPQAGEALWARGEFRRVLQILINLVGNAIAYSPRDSQVWVRLDRRGRFASVTVADLGRGLTVEEQARVFDKFERLGRKDENGSGLGLYIAARLARAMEGNVSVESAPGQGARFTLALPALD